MLRCTSEANRIQLSIAELALFWAQRTREAEPCNEDVVKARCVHASPGASRWGGPGLDLDIARRGNGGMRLVSRHKPGFSFSGSVLKEGDGIAVRRRVQDEIRRSLEGGKYVDGRREAAISIGREGTCEREFEDLTTG